MPPSGTAPGTAFRRRPRELRTRLANVGRALDAAGRHPSTLILTAGIFVAYDDAEDDAPERAIRGSTSEIADALAGYAELGIAHLIVHLFPRTPEAVARLGEAAAMARERLGVAAVPAGEVTLTP